MLTYITTCILLLTSSFGKLNVPLTPWLSMLTNMLLSGPLLRKTLAIVLHRHYQMITVPLNYFATADPLHCILVPLYNVNEVSDSDILPQVNNEIG